MQEKNVMMHEDFEFFDIEVFIGLYDTGDGETFKGVINWFGHEIYQQHTKASRWDGDHERFMEHLRKRNAHAMRLLRGKTLSSHRLFQDVLETQGYNLRANHTHHFLIDELTGERAIQMPRDEDTGASADRQGIINMMYSQLSEVCPKLKEA